MFVKKLTLVTGGFDPIHSGHMNTSKKQVNYLTS